MIYDFDKIVDRRNSGSYKWDGMKRLFGRDDLLPFWVADMDFATPKPVTDAFKQRLEHPVFGYKARGESYCRAILKWLAVRHGWVVKREWLTFCPPGVVQSIHMLVNLLSEPGDEIILQTPAYNPLINVVTGNNRKLLRNELKLTGNRYEIDFDDLTRKISGKTRLMILCSPHNPSGRVWKEDELGKLTDICIDNNIKIISDEIHADFVYKGHRHIPLGSLSDKARNNAITCLSAGKTFNISGLQQAVLVIPDEATRTLFEEARDVAQINLDNIFSEVATEAAYTHCGEWLDQLITYLQCNVEYLSDYLGKNLPEVNVIKPEGTYLVWLDMRELGKSSREINDLLVNRAGVALYEGKEFGEKREGFFRMNIACPRTLLSDGLKRISDALKNY